MKVKECMSRDVRVVNAEEPIQDAAATMADIDAGENGQAQFSRLAK